MLPHIMWNTPCVIVNTSTTRYVTGIGLVHHSPPANNKYVYKSMRCMSVCRSFGAGEGIRTLDPNLGKVVLYH